MAFTLCPFTLALRFRFHRLLLIPSPELSYNLWHWGIFFCKNFILLNWAWAISASEYALLYLFNFRRFFQSSLLYKRLIIFDYLSSCNFLFWQQTCPLTSFVLAFYHISNAFLIRLQRRVFNHRQFRNCIF